MAKRRRAFDPATYRSPLEGREDFSSEAAPPPPGFGGRWVMWALKGGVAAYMPAPDPRWSRRQIGAYTARRDANLMLVCPDCGASGPALPAKRLSEGEMAHEHDCLLTDGSLRKILAP